MSATTALQQTKSEQQYNTQSAPQQPNSASALAFVDRRPQAVAQRRLQELASNSPQTRQLNAYHSMALNSPDAVQLSALQNEMSPNSQAKAIQCYSYSAGTTRGVTVTGSGGKTRSFQECTYNSVEYKKNDLKQAGTGTSSPAEWAGWVVNKKGGRNATQLHIVNGRWGGKGGRADGNIVPGSPAENSHHLHEAEKKFDEICFNNTNTAVQDCKYECTATPKYSTAEDVSLADKNFGDPTLAVTITTATGSTVYPVTDGSEGLVLQDGG